MAVSCAVPAVLPVQDKAVCASAQSGQRSVTERWDTLARGVQHVQGQGGRASVSTFSAGWPAGRARGRMLRHTRVRGCFLAAFRVPPSGLSPCALSLARRLCRSARTARTAPSPCSAARWCAVGRQGRRPTTGRVEAQRHGGTEAPRALCAKPGYGMLPATRIDACALAPGAGPVPPAPG